jgi:hypothetical protein
MFTALVRGHHCDACREEAARVSSDAMDTDGDCRATWQAFKEEQQRTQVRFK